MTCLHFLKKQNGKDYFIDFVKDCKWSFINVSQLIPPWTDRPSRRKSRAWPFLPLSGSSFQWRRSRFTLETTRHCLSNNMEAKCLPFKLVAIIDVSAFITPRLKQWTWTDLNCNIYFWNNELTFRRISGKQFGLCNPENCMRFVKSGFRNPKRWILKNVFILDKAHCCLTDRKTRWKARKSH